MDEQKAREPKELPEPEYDWVDPTENFEAGVGGHNSKDVRVLGVRIRKIRLAMMWNQGELAEKLHSNADRVRSLELGRVKRLYDAEVESLANIGFDRRWLITGEGEMLAEDSLRRRKKVPFFNYVRASAGTGIEVFEEEPDGIFDIPVELLKRGNKVHCIRVSGDSMYPRFDDGDYIFVDISERRIAAEAIYVLRVDSTLLVKKVQWTPEGLALISQNADYKTITLLKEMFETSNIDVIGRVVGSWSYY